MEVKDWTWKYHLLVNIFNSKNFPPKNQWNRNFSENFFRSNFRLQLCSDGCSNLGWLKNCAENFAENCIKIYKNVTMGAFLLQLEALEIISNVSEIPCWTAIGFESLTLFSPKSTSGLSRIRCSAAIGFSSRTAKHENSVLYTKRFS